MKLRGKDLKVSGWRPGPLFGLALRTGQRLVTEGNDREAVLTALAHVAREPHLYVDHPEYGDLAKRLIEDQRALQQLNPTIRDEPIHFAIWGAEQIDKGAIQQMQAACSLPVTVAGALMPDAHVGYGVPIGGVVATRGAVIPYAVGVDIACRMRLSILDMSPEEMARNREPLKQALRRETSFGVGAIFNGRQRRDHAVMEHGAWRELDVPTRQRLRDTAAAQLGTSGSGNHFVEWGEVELHEAVGDLAPGRHVALLSHSGSRGLGARLADHFTKLAMSLCKLPQNLKHLAWLPLDSHEGQAYWVAMNLAGLYAQANHELIHRHVIEAAGLQSVFSTENHHNFAWLEQHGGEELVVHRKGATPAGVGVLGIIPGSMAAPGFLVRGKGDTASLHSASHGAGRAMSRRAALDSISKADWQSQLDAAGVELLGGGRDEAPQAYKPILEVMAAQRDLVDILGTFHLRLVLMSDEKNPKDI